MLDLTKPMQTKAGGEVFGVYKSTTLDYGYCLIVDFDQDGERRLTRFTKEGKYFGDVNDSEWDLINVPGTEYWSCPDDVPKDKSIWIRRKDWGKGDCELVVDITIHGIRTANCSECYERLHHYQYLNNGEWVECVK
jgi:hypothetical protein